MAGVPGPVAPITVSDRDALAGQRPEHPDASS